MARTGTSSSWQVTPAPDRKVLLLLRHAKSDWDTGEVDHERPLNRRGRADAAAVGQVLAGHGMVPDLVACSTATRTRETWDRAVGAGAQAGEVRYLDDIYSADVATLVGVVQELPEAAETVLLIGHNPGVSELVRSLAVRTDTPAWVGIDQGYPTAGLAVLTLPGPWHAAGTGAADLVTFEVPRGSALK